MNKKEIEELQDSLEKLEEILKTVYFDGLDKIKFGNQIVDASEVKEFLIELKSKIISILHHNNPRSYK